MQSPESTGHGLHLVNATVLPGQSPSIQLAAMSTVVETVTGNSLRLLMSCAGTRITHISQGCNVENSWYNRPVE